MACRSFVVGLVCDDQLVPLKRAMAPPAPTANTLVPEVPQTALSAFVVGDVTLLHAVPLCCRMTPPAPTANTLVAEEPHTSLSRFGVTVDSGAQRLTGPGEPVDAMTVATAYPVMPSVVAEMIVWPVVSGVTAADD